jgi:hypothetical protein
MKYLIKFFLPLFFLLTIFCQNELSLIMSHGEKNLSSFESDYVHEELYLLSLFDYHFLFDESEKDYYKNTNKKVINEETQILSLNNFFISLADKTIDSIGSLCQERSDFSYLLRLCKAVLEDSIYATSRLFAYQFFKEITFLLQELYAAQSSLALYDKDKLKTYLISRLSSVSSSYFFKFAREQNEEERQAFLMTMKTMFWIFYISPHLKKLFHEKKEGGHGFEIADIEVSFCFFPLKSFQLNQTYEKIQYYDTIARFFPPKTINGSDYLRARISLPFFSEDMAIDLIDRDVNISQKAMSSRHEKIIEEITKIYYEKIIPVIRELRELEEDKSNSVIDYFYSFIPPRFLFQGSKESGKGSFFSWGLIQRYMNPSLLIQPLLFFKDLKQYDQAKKASWMHSPLIKSYGSGFLNLLPARSRDIPEEAMDIIKNYYQKKTTGLDQVSDNVKSMYKNYFHDNHAEFFSHIDSIINQHKEHLYQDIPKKYEEVAADLDRRSEKLTWGDVVYSYKMQDGSYYPFLQKRPYLLQAVALFEQLPKAAMNLYAGYLSFQHISREYRVGIANTKRYFLLQRKLIIYTKEIFDIFRKLFFVLGEDNKPSPEYVLVKKYFSLMKKDKNHIFNQILSFNKNYISSLYNNILGFLSPGLFSHFYFNAIDHKKELGSLHCFLGYIEFFLQKISLLKKTKEADYSFSLPAVVKSKEAILDIKNMWFPGGMKNPTKNSLLLHDNERNMLLVSPVAGGKTVLLSTLLTVLHMGNIGIVPAESMRYTYFSKIIDHLTHEYIVGGGLSQHLAERKSMEFIQEVIEKNHSDKLIVFIDEIFRGTRPDLAVQEAFLILPNILKRKNVITIITTHFPEMIPLTKKENLSLVLYYLVVDFVSGLFQRRFLLSKDNEHNWWIRDPSLAMLYQQSIKF